MSTEYHDIMVQSWFDNKWKGQDRTTAVETSESPSARIIISYIMIK